MVREIVLPMQTSTEDLDTLIDRIGVPEIFVAPLKQLIAEPATLDTLVPDKHLLEMLTSAQRFTFFQCRVSSLLLSLVLALVLANLWLISCIT